MNMFKTKIGIDLGNGYVKFRGEKFASKVSTGVTANFGKKQENVHNVIYDGMTYKVGTGDEFLSDRRYFSEEYLVSLLTAISLVAPENETSIEAEICVGLPVTVFCSPIRFELEKYLNGLCSDGSLKFVLEGKDKLITITKAKVYVEGAYILETGFTGRALTIDVGAGTVNIIEWDNLSPVKYHTIDESFIAVYNTMVEYLRDTGKGNVSIDFIEKNYGKKEVMINRQPVNIERMYTLMNSFVQKVVSKIKIAGFATKEVEKIVLLGGGAEPTSEYFKKEYGEDIEVVENGQYVNSEIFEKAIDL